MGQKVHPKIQRIGIIETWSSRWFAKKKEYTKLFHQDLEVKKTIRKELPDAGVSKIEIYRAPGNVTLNIWTARPGIIIGRQGENISELKEKMNKIFHTNFTINIKEIKKPDLDALLVAENITKQIEKRISYRRASKMALSKSMESGAKGAKILVSGRLNGVEISRDEQFLEGKIPLHTFRADIDYACVPARTTYGVIGVKVWIYRGEVFKKKKEGKLEITEKKVEKNEKAHEFLPM
ncbi:30S ribosomal protein S3 [Candidatus Peregrinibacteria bacterium]|nr:30S ribosomal protein S3 [Candidatus Peregrinibacteria bacterium]